MRLRWIAIAFFVLLLGSSQTAWSESSITVDLGSGRVLSQVDPFARWYPASLTKLMTAYVSFRALQAGEVSLNSPVVMSKHAAGQPPSKIGFKAGSIMTLDNALKMMLVKSANDIAVAVAESVGGSEAAFVARMNGEAQRIGMFGSHFSNPSGLPKPDQYVTARDMALLVMHIRREFPQYAGYFSIEAISTGTRTYNNYNLLIGHFDGADGMKTGFTCDSGFNEIGSATRNGRTLVAVVLGASSLGDRAEEAAARLSHGFEQAPDFGPTLESLQPYGDHVDQVVSMRDQICSKKAREARAGERDDDGNLVVASQYFHPNPDPKVVQVGLGGAVNAAGQEIPAAAPTVGGARVPLPTPRPDIAGGDRSAAGALPVNAAEIPLPQRRAYNVN